jgi:hypothetical protein
VPSSISNSDPAEAPGAPAVTDQESDFWRRSSPALAWRSIAMGALVATAVLVGGWEMYWRAHWMEPGDFRNSAGQWAEQRRRATGDATIIVGSSRILFGLDLDVWERAGHDRPVQLALQGTSPRIFLHDLAEDESVRGLVIVGVMQPLFFGQDGGLRGDYLEHYRNETPSERADSFLANQLERVFAFPDDETRPAMLLRRAPLPIRAGTPPRVEPNKLSIMTADRNTEMWRRVVDDPAYQQYAKDTWVDLIELLSAPPPGAPPPPPDAPPGFPDQAVTAVIALVKADVDRIRARGGEVVFVRYPYEGAWEMENFAFPRARTWDRLIAETDSIGITFQDYPELQGYVLPEWSHLEARDAERFTADLARILYARLEERRAGAETPAAQTVPASAR